MKSEIEFALRKTKLNKAMGPDEINTEMIKTLEDIGIDTLHKLFNKMYETGEIPSDMAKSISSHYQRNHAQKFVKNIEQLA